MPWEIRDGGEQGTTAGLTLALPSGWAADDIFVIVAECVQTETISVPSGFTELTDSPQTGADTKLHVFWRRAVGGDGSVSVGDPGDHIVAKLFAIRGATTSGNPFRDTAGTTASASTAVVFQDIAADAGDYVMLIDGNGRDTSSMIGSFDSVTNIETGGSYLEGEAQGTSGNGGGFIHVSGIAPATANSGGTATILVSVAQTKISFSMIPDGNHDEILASRVGLGAVVDTTGGALAVSRVGLGAVIDVDAFGYSSYMAASRVGIGFVIMEDPSSFKRRWRANVN